MIQELKQEEIDALNMSTPVNTDEQKKRGDYYGGMTIMHIDGFKKRIASNEFKGEQIL